MSIGTSSGKWFGETVDELGKGPLEGWVAEIIDLLWDPVKDDALLDNLRDVRR